MPEPDKNSDPHATPEPTTGADPDPAEFFPDLPEPAPPPKPPIFPSIPARKPDEKKPASSLADVGRGWSVALEFVFTILASGGLGYAFDTWKGTAHTGTLIGLALGFVIAFWRIVKDALAQDRREQQKKR